MWIWMVISPKSQVTWYKPTSNNASGYDAEISKAMIDWNHLAMVGCGSAFHGRFKVIETALVTGNIAHDSPGS